ncbi:MAG: tRNA nucleotidyltransferase [Clostridia bacterium]|nr:tRNA nucleotidyltransferase [Clostridia bacterium]
MTNEFERDIEMARRIAREIDARGGRTFYVGGFVRDAIIGRENKDVDIEIHGVSPAGVQEALDSLGTRLNIGESFGIFGLKGYSVDIAMPRQEKLRGVGHRDFDVSVDPFIGTFKAAERRDFTINALMQDVLTGEIIDHFGGREHLKKGLIRHVNDITFAEDPLRVLRAAQFAARFGFDVAGETVELCRRMDLSALSKERIDGEMRKALMKAERPSVFFETLREMNQLSVWFPELEALIGVEQNPKFHAEGDVWTHTMMVVDAAARFRDRAADPLGLMLSAVTHDFGKAVTTERIDGVIHAYGHELKGVPLAERFLGRITNEKRLTEYVLNMVEHHMRPNTAAATGASVKSTNKMFDRSIDPEGLICIALSDDLGKISDTAGGIHEEFLYERLRIFKEYMARPAVMGRDLIAAGLKPDARFTEILSYAHKLHLAGVAKEDALRQTLAYARKLKG